MKSPIAIIGANGQVGSEVCLLLQRMGVDVAPICRTRFASVFLRACGFACRHGSVSSPEEAKDLLQGCETVVDFSLPHGPMNEVRPIIHTTLANTFQNAPSLKRHIYASTIMAFGMSDAHPHLRSHVTAHTIYGASKRYGESVARKYGNQMGKDVYLLRLGEVNGEIQNCTRSRTEDLAQACPRQVIVPSGTSYAVFTLNIAQALISIANGEQEPGLYTMVSDPEIAWKALGHYYLERANLDAEVVEAGRASPSVVSAGLRVLTTLAERYRNEISSYLTFLFPGLENRLRLERFRRAAAAQVGAISSQHHRLFSQTFVGRLPGRRLGGLCTDWETTRREMRSFREELRTRGTLCRHAGESFGTGV